MNIKEIKEMISLMNENGLVELEVEKEGLRVRLKKTSSGGEASAMGPIIIEKERISQAQSAPASREEARGKETPANTIEIKAPMVGTFYRAPSPESPPYVEVGQVIEPGQVICIIEAMKLMNEIKSEVKGKIIEIQVDNTEPVEFGQPMFLIAPI
ncbi:MAG: acetyl-CoA carboxylase biotin carboxyl carrier protein [Candidatus Omnitrophica bacterium]|nr:acetyl-CoA carboxylase biotin carboxyl carrier protein [Candidatus Omnitrophota bacterium]